MEDTTALVIASPEARPVSREETILVNLQGIFARLFEIEQDDVQVDATFFEMGIDSISIIQVRQLIQNEYGVEISVNTLYGDASTLQALARYVDQQLPYDTIADELIEAPLSFELPLPGNDIPLGESANEETTLLESIINQQLELMAQQLELFRASPATRTVPANSQKQPLTSVTPKPMNPSVSPILPSPSPKAAPAPVTHPDAPMGEPYQHNLRRFISLHNQRTAKSKALIQQHRAHFANNRLTASYNRATKEIMYPIIAEQAKGARIWDVDGNEYIDMCLGFGAFLLGYNHPTIEQAIIEQTQKGIFLGAFSTLPGEVAELIAQMTGVDRVAFYNSGTEAVMVALRLARAYTGKSRVVIFAGSYHGTFDGVLVQKDIFTRDFKPAPKSTGIPQKFIDDVLLLDYGTEESLTIIREHAHELAAVLVEPVQSRRPEFQPRAYLHELRQITEASGVPLIFDEIITGFRIHPAGAQHWFGVQADLVTYGKIVGGGLPLGIVAGKAEFMHGIDGGFWNYGDDSHPKFDHRKTFVAGTFCHHPLAMASAKAILQLLNEQGPALQATLTDRTAQFAQQLNAFFTKEKLPISIVYFGSLFQVRSYLDLSLFYYHLLSKGIYVWEGMTFFISTAHSEADIAQFVRAVEETAIEMRAAGFWPVEETVTA